ncbi:MAG: hypothetical protein WBA57_02035 [Elainellaceae cyanobacterium]
MLPAFIDSIQAEMAEQADAAREEFYLDGATDAAFGQLPEYAHDAYLAGYVAKLKELPTDANGRLIHYAPQQHFALGYMDTPDSCPCYDEF